MGQSRSGNQRDANDENQGAEFHLSSPLALILRAQQARVTLRFSRMRWISCSPFAALT
jgi:hypothetical protein